MSALHTNTVRRVRVPELDTYTAPPLQGDRPFWIPEALHDQTRSGESPWERSSHFLAPQQAMELHLVIVPSGNIIADFAKGTNFVLDLEGEVPETDISDITEKHPQTRIVLDADLNPLQARLLSFCGSDPFAPESDAFGNREVIQRTISFLIGVGRQEHFEDGMDNDFSRGLTSLIETYGEPTVEELADFVSSGRMSGELAAEALVCLARIEDPWTLVKRRSLLETSLSSSSHFIRDGALLGLSYLDDPHAIPHLKRAIERETNTQLERYMQQVLQELEAAD